MNFLDIRTVLILYMLTNAICLTVIFILWRWDRGRSSGIGLWLVDYLMQFVALLLLALRGSVPEAVSALLGNGLVIGGTIILLIGLEQFTGKRGSHFHNLVLLSVFFAVHAYFLFITPSLTARNINISAALMAVTIQGVWLTWRRVDPDMRRITRSVGIIFGAYFIVSLLRIIVDLIVPSGNDLFQMNAYDTLVLLIYQLLFIGLTFSLFLMVNRRLIKELERDMAVRREIAEALRVSEEKFSKAFHASPDAILITRLRDGKIQEVNDGFSRLSEFTREDALTSSTLQLSLWADPADRDQFLAALRAEGRVSNQEFDIRSKSGKILHCLISAEPIGLDGEPHILSIVRDISEWNKAQEILRLRLSLWEFAANHTADELMQKALDDIERITESPISFYHFVLEDERTLSLQTWSTRTLREFCQAQGRGTHYDLDQAGVWADAVRRRKPVIHNVYESLPGRKGLPEGHARIDRELVAPTLRAGRVVSVLGVGNKSTPYTSQDAELLSYIADIVWGIIDRKRTDEEILRLQGQLREMALHDPLTGLYNRHYMEETLSRELARAAREKYPVSFIMIDIDHFKTVNDAVGHAAGDEVLQALASQLRGGTRASDILYRYGGEEFLAVLPKAKSEFALRAAEKWRVGFRDSPAVLASAGVPVTISCGIASFPDDGDIASDLVARADQALYKAKAAGRDQSAVWKG